MQGNFLVKSGVLSFGMWNTAKGIRNPTNDWIPDPKFYRQILECNSWNPGLTAWNPEPKLSWFPYIGWNHQEPKTCRRTVFTLSDHISVRKQKWPMFPLSLSTSLNNLYRYFTLAASIQRMLALSVRTIFYPKYSVMLWENNHILSYKYQLSRRLHVIVMFVILSSVRLHHWCKNSRERAVHDRSRSSWSIIRTSAVHSKRARELRHCF